MKQKVSLKTYPVLESPSQIYSAAPKQIKYVYEKNYGAR